MHTDAPFITEVNSIRYKWLTAYLGIPAETRSLNRVQKKLTTLFSALLLYTHNPHPLKEVRLKDL